MQMRPGIDMVPSAAVLGHGLRQPLLAVVRKPFHASNGRFWSGGLRLTVP
jgi:hypothetical protein